MWWNCCRPMSPFFRKWLQWSDFASHLSSTMEHNSLPNELCAIVLLMGQSSDVRWGRALRWFVHSIFPHSCLVHECRRLEQLNRLPTSVLWANANFGLIAVLESTLPTHQHIIIWKSLEHIHTCFWISWQIGVPIYTRVTSITQWLNFRLNVRNWNWLTRNRLCFVLLYMRVTVSIIM